MGDVSRAKMKRKASSLHREEQEYHSKPGVRYILIKNRARHKSRPLNHDAICVFHISRLPHAILAMKISTCRNVEFCRR
jgi:hypothetical protein